MACDLNIASGTAAALTAPAAADIPDFTVLFFTLSIR
jgi:hypothetical protein